MKIKILLFPLLTAYAGSLFAIPQAISVNVYSDNGQSTDVQMESGFSAGVALYSNWNNVGPFGGSVSGGTDLDDNEGTGTTADVSFSYNGNDYAHTFSDPTDPDVRMMNGWAGMNSVTFSDLPSFLTDNGYDVYVYFDAHSATHEGTFSATIGTTTIWGEDNGDYVNGTETYVRATGTTSGTANISNYVRIEGVTGSGFTASFGGTSSEPITGVQLVAIPEPSAVLMMVAGILGLAAYRRRLRLN